ncbi:ABC transporter B family member 29, chloroplastic isoform X2 [Cryptomeria japonica]|uniref:ABC transporter B family member 29, chloroplastic isoform X2 n=1 Tax=Cryptomeria japonica TaxID=3369 RepID=UPI0027DA8772|nr:ABC transporter B family member 29, chloroplastic isoform X2 [Cryptomeria japonica]
MASFNCKQTLHALPYRQPYQITNKKIITHISALYRNKNLISFMSQNFSNYQNIILIDHLKAFNYKQREHSQGKQCEFNANFFTTHSSASLYGVQLGLKPCITKSASIFGRNLSDHQNSNGSIRKKPIFHSSGVQLGPVASDHLKSYITKSAATNIFFPFSHTYKFIKPFVERQWRPISKAWLCSIIAVGCLFYVIPQFGDLSTLLVAGDLSNLRKKALIAMFFVVLRSVAQYFQQALLWKAALNVSYEIRGHVFERVLNRDMSYFEGAGGALAGDIAYRITAEAEDAADTVYALLHTLVPSTLQLTTMTFRMFFLSPILSMATISVIPCTSLSIAFLGEKLRHISRKGQDSIARISSFLNEVLPAMIIVKAHNAEDCELWRFKKLAEADRNAHLSKKKLKAFIPELVGVAYAGTALILVLAGSWIISCGAFNGADMVSFVTSLALLVEPIQAIGKAYNELKQGEPAIERLFELTTFCPQVVDKNNNIPLSSVAGDVKFCNVSFRYGNTQPQVLSALSFHVRAGETIALVGQSGGGKTTLAKLLLRLYDPIEGCILVDDHDIRNISLKRLRQCIGLVPQENVLFAGSIAENIGYGNMPNMIDMKKVEQAAKLANADGFIRKLPKGYDTDVGQRGSCLSGGQRQRVAIARAIYQESSILILDEATSALDNKSELLVREALEHLTANRTVFVIAHRLETVSKADRIFLLDGGKLVEEGTHSSLLAQSGFYASLYSSKELFKGV